jgi:hypothetical protein
MARKSLFPVKRKLVRTKPSISVKKTKFGLEIIKTVYDEFGKVVTKQVEAIKK